MAETREVDEENYLSPKEVREYKEPSMASKFDVKKKIVPLTVLVTVILITVIIGLVVALVTQGKCQSPDPDIIPFFRDPCENGWIWYMKKCYFFSTSISEWKNSQEFCASRNASLAIIDWRYELDFILRFKGSSDHWIGLKRESEVQPWVWTNGSIFNDLFPIVGFSNCVLVNSGRISSASCFSDKHWICNKPDAHSLNPLF